MAREKAWPGDRRDQEIRRIMGILTRRRITPRF